MTVEFSHPRRIDTLGSAPTPVDVTADAEERAALARRFGLIALDALAAQLTLLREGETVTLTGQIDASVVQACVATSDPVAARIDEPVLLRFVPDTMLAAHEEVELHEGDCDTIGYSGSVIDVGEVVAETLALALDPFPRSAAAAASLKAAGVIGEDDVENGAFAGLAALRDRLRGD